MTAHRDLAAYPTRDDAITAATTGQRQKLRPWRVWRCLHCGVAFHAAPWDNTRGPDRAEVRRQRQRAALAHLPHKPSARARVTDFGADHMDIDDIAVERWLAGDRSVALNYRERMEAARHALALGWTENQVLVALGVNGVTWRKLRAAALSESEAAA